MKKLLGFAAVAVAALALISCASGGNSSPKASPYTITEGDGVIGYFSFDEEEIEDNEIIDHSGNECNLYTAALDGSILEPGKRGNALSLNGADEYITLDREILDGDGFTVCAWVKAASWAIWGRVFDFGDCRTDVFVAVDGRTPGTLGMREEGTACQVNCPLPPVGQWVHVAATFGKNKMALYINGKLSQELPCPVDIDGLRNQDNPGLYVGRSNWSADPLFNGALDELLIANRKFSSKEIASVYAGVIGVDAN